MNPKGYSYPELPQSWRRDKEYWELIQAELRKSEQEEDAPRLERMKPRLIKNLNKIEGNAKR